MTKCKINQDLCAQCGACISVCTEEAIDMDGEGVVTINADKCNGCKECKEVCPAEAIESYEE